MDIKASLAAGVYASARPATAPRPQPETAGAGFAALAGNFADVLARGDETAKAAIVDCH